MTRARIGLLITLTLVAATLPISARTAHAAGPADDADGSGKSRPPTKATTSSSKAMPSPELPGQSSSPGQKVKTDRSSATFQVAPNADVWDAGVTRTLPPSLGGLWTGPTAEAARLVPRPAARYVAVVAQQGRALHTARVWLRCRYPHAPPVQTA